jgi:hypothetical protein
MSRSTRRDSTFDSPGQSPAETSPRRAEPAGASSADVDALPFRADVFVRDEGDPDGSLTIYCIYCGPDLPGAKPGAVFDARGYGCAGCGTLLLVH